MKRGSKKQNMFKHFVEGVKQLMVSVLTIPNGFPAARVNRTIRTLSTQFSRNYSLPTWNSSLLLTPLSIKPHASLCFLTLHLKSEHCVTSYKYVAASSALDWATESWVRPARPGAATCHCSLHSPASPCSDQFHLSPASPALPPAQPVASGALLNPCLSLPGTWSSQWQPKRFLHGWGKYSNNTLLISTKTVSIVPTRTI